MTKLGQLSDQALVAHLTKLCVAERRVIGRILLVLIEIEERRLHLRSACDSLFTYCTARLGMSEGMAFRRVHAARLVKRFPTILPRVEDGRIHLSHLVVLRHVMTEENVEELLDLAEGKTKRELESLLLQRKPPPLLVAPEASSSPPDTSSPEALPTTTPPSVLPMMSGT